MAKVKIQGHASGTGVLTVTAPNTSTDRTITLPDATGTLATTADTTDLDGAITINESGADVDFRVESDTKTHALFLDGADGNVRIGSGTDVLSNALQVIGTDANSSKVSISRFDTNGAKYPALRFLSSKNATPGSNTIVADGDNIGSIDFHADDGTDYESICATISAQIDGTAGANDVPGRLIFSTAADGAAIVTERLRITSDGRGLSQFTAKAWARVDMEAGTMALTDSHNISSVTDRGVGLGRVTFANNMANANYTVAGNALDGGGENDIRIFNHSNETTWSTSIFDWYTLDANPAVNDAMNATMIFFGD